MFELQNVRVSDDFNLFCEIKTDDGIFGDIEASVDFLVLLSNLNDVERVKLIEQMLSSVQY